MALTENFEKMEEIIRQTPSPLHPNGASNRSSYPSQVRVTDEYVSSQLEWLS